MIANPIPWPEGCRCAVAFTYDMDADSILSGRLARAAAINELIEYMQTKDGVWFATLADIASHVRKVIADGTWQPRIDRLPYYPGPIPELG